MKWTRDALSAPHTQRHLDAIPQGVPSPIDPYKPHCLRCGQPRRIIKDNETIGIKGVRLLPCECEGKK